MKKCSRRLISLTHQWDTIWLYIYSCLYVLQVSAHICVSAFGERKCEREWNRSKDSKRTREIDKAWDGRNRSRKINLNEQGRAHKRIPWLKILRCHWKCIKTQLLSQVTLHESLSLSIRTKVWEKDTMQSKDTVPSLLKHRNLLRMRKAVQLKWLDQW